MLATYHDEIVRAINDAKLSILRAIHSGDKVASILIHLVDAIKELYPPPDDLYDTEAWREAEAYVLRLCWIKDSKRKGVDETNTTQEKDAP